jgi:hypothetical protein
VDLDCHGLPKAGQKVFFAAGPMMDHSWFRAEQVQPSDDGPAWITLTGRRVTHWMPAEECPAGGRCLLPDLGVVLRALLS